MEKQVKGRFVTDFYGSTPAMGATELLKQWIEDKQNAWLLSWADKIKKKGETAAMALEKILSVFHRDEKNQPVLGNWMLRRCLINTGYAIFNAMKDKTQPKRNIIPMAINLVTPIHMNIYNGKVVTKPHGVKTYTVTVKGRSFFCAYEYIKAGTTFDATIYVDESLISQEHFEQLLSKAGLVGVGAYRERFGKFEWIK
jgi:hypothetical protein